MVIKKSEPLTRSGVIQLGFLVLLLGGLSYFLFRALGIEAATSGIAAEALLVILVFGWTGSYLFRVFTGNMTFMEQRKRYRKAYEEIKTNEMQKIYESMPKDEQIKLMTELENEKNSDS